MRRQKEKESDHFRKKSMQLLESGKISVKRVLMPKKKRKELDNALFGAAGDGENAEIGRLIRAGAKINMRNPDGRTPLMEATQYNRQEACAILLEHGADVNARNIDNFTALMIAAMNGHNKICTMLLEKGADASIKDKNNGMTAFMWAVHALKVRRRITRETINILAESGVSMLMEKETAKSFVDHFRACIS